MSLKEVRVNNQYDRIRIFFFFIYSLEPDGVFEKIIQQHSRIKH